MSETRRGRPRSFDPQVALKQASDVFRTSGYASTSLDDIVRATGLNRPSLYAAFGDKKSLYVAAIERLWAAIAAQFDALEARDLPLEDSLRAMLTGSIEAYLAGDRPKGCLAICTAATEAVNDEDIRDALAKVRAGGPARRSGASLASAAGRGRRRETMAVIGPGPRRSAAGGNRSTPRSAGRRAGPRPGPAGPSA